MKKIDWEKFQNYYDQGNTIFSTMKYFNVGSFSTVQNAIRNKKFKSRDKRNCQLNQQHKRDLSRLIELYEQGSSINDLIKIYGYTRSDIEYCKSSSGLKMRSLSQALINRRKVKGIQPMGVKARHDLSVRQSINNTGGKSKWYEVAGQKVQGTWERDIAFKLEELGIKWYKPKVNKDVWSYVLDDKMRSYTPDIHLLDLDIYLEIKGYWWGNDREKMNAVLEQHKNKKLIIIEQADYEKIKKGILPW